ncbi:hypothetical protein [Mycobacterium celatum]|uniref:Uncharacterized protein n=1 Tax=Mycobacterium celatum TaxID=28045 RepID=A0A1X1RJZ1_MYCCE|nr:hypothetical protein [Mycobacterium celatum]ORV07917.1 hypothetical protein AWB95_21125 [Mycobacterium celatum]PIB75319.1 hypothetical protein CQY23_20145 [Mycobacterium celatum]
MNGDDELDARFLLSARTTIDVLSHQPPSLVAQRDAAGSALAPPGGGPPRRPAASQRHMPISIPEPAQHLTLEEL